MTVRGSWALARIIPAAIMAPLGWLGLVTTVNKFGRNRDVDTGTVPEAIWDAPTADWVPPTAARIHTLTGDINDDIAGTGAQKVMVEALDVSWVEFTEIVEMNGVAGKAMVKAAVRINRMETIQAGALGENSANINAVAAVDGTTTSRITAGEGQTLQAIYSVPAKKTALLTCYFSSIVKAGGASLSAVISLRVRKAADAVGALFVVKHTIGLTKDGGAPYLHAFNPFFLVPEKSDVLLRVDEVTASDADISGGFDLYLIPNWN